MNTSISLHFAALHVAYVTIFPPLTFTLVWLVSFLEQVDEQLSSPLSYGAG